MTLQHLRSFGSSGLSKRSLWVLGLGVALMAALPGCVAHAEGALVADYPVDYVETVPERIEYYPRTYYRGNPAYLVEGRWYYRSHNRWTVFREEPVELRNYRVRREPRYLTPQNRAYGRSQERLIAERRAEDHRRREWADAQRANEHRRAEQSQQPQRAEEHRRFEQQRDAQHRAEEDRRIAERRGRATRKRDRSHGDQHDSRDERDRRRYRQD